MKALQQKVKQLTEHNNHLQYHSQGLELSLHEVQERSLKEKGKFGEAMIKQKQQFQNYEKEFR